MSETSYIRGTNFAATLEAALREFHRALTYRWRVESCQAVEHDRPFVPPGVTQHRLTTPPQHLEPYWQGPVWSYSTLPARAHIDPGSCASLAWVRNGQPGDLRAVHCDGLVTERIVIDPVTQAPVVMPDRIDCGVGRILQQVEDWAWAERSRILARLPLFDHHDMDALKQAYDDLIRIGVELGLHLGAGIEASEAPVELSGTGDLVHLVSSIAVRDADGQGWWTEWTGLAASLAGNGFFASVAPTRSNQSRIAGALAILLSDRAAIIEKGRCDTLSWIEWATHALYRTETVVTDLTYGWKAVQSVGQGIVVGAGVTPILGPVGAAVALTGFLGENLVPEVRNEHFHHAADEVVTHLDQKIGEVHAELDELERLFRGAAKRLRSAIYGIHSYNLELYDLTRNDPEGSGRDPGRLTANVPSILRLAEQCYEAGDGYQRLLQIIAGTSRADPHLAGRDGRPTSGDQELLEVRDDLERFLRTTTARYLIAADQVRVAAAAYAELDADLQRVFKEWDERGVGRVDVGLDLDSTAAGTDRSGYNPLASSPFRFARRFSQLLEPGHAQGDQKYVIEEE